MCWIVFGISCTLAREHGPLGALLAIALMVGCLYIFLVATAISAPRRARIPRRFRG